MAIVEKGYVETNFTAADSPRILNVRDDLSEAARFALLSMVAHCDGPGDILLEVSQVPQGADPVFDHGAGFLEEGETVKLEDFQMTHLQIIHTGVDSSYRIVVFTRR